MVMMYMVQKLILLVAVVLILWEPIQIQAVPQVVRVILPKVILLIPVLIIVVVIMAVA